ncbi:MAG: NADH-ubiquinone dehydrogenase [Mesorhizobium sp.]|nr:NADH-ubiquinone dehydrogenase [Mesorhizobium sp.]
MTKKPANPMTSLMPRDFAETADMMARPLAGAAAMSALGLGLASHAFGLWFGAVAGSMDAARRLFDLDMPHPGAAPRLEDGPDFASKRNSPAVSARAAVETLLADAGAAAERATSTTPEERARLAPPVAKPLRPVARPAAMPSPAAAVAPVEAKQAAALMPEDFVKPAAIEKPAVPDDLKAISGVGPKLEQVLNGLGIWTLGQIAAWSPAEIAWVDDYLGFKGRIGRDGWIEQAKSLMGGGSA